MGMGHQDFKTECGRHCCDEGLCWHRSPSPACPSPEPCREAPLSPGPPFREKPAIPHLGCCWDAARPWQQFCFWRPRWILTELQTGYPGLHRYPCWISQRLGHADPSCPSLNPSLMAKRGPWLSTSSEPQWSSRARGDQPCLPAPLSCAGF